MLIIQFITMSNNKLQKVVKKYEKRYKLNKSDFIKFVTSKIDFSQEKCTQFLTLIKNQINSQFDVEQLYKLLHSIAAFQADRNPLLIDEEDLPNFIKIRFKDDSKNKEPEPVQKNQKNIIPKEETKIKGQTKPAKKDNQYYAGDKFNESINTNFRTQAKQPEKKAEIKLDIQQIDGDDQYQVQTYNKKSNQEEQRQKRMRQRQRQIEEEEQRNKRKQIERVEKENAQRRRIQKQRIHRQQRVIEMERRKKQEEMEQSAQLKRKAEIERLELKKKSSNSIKSENIIKEPKVLKTIQEQKTDQININSGSSNVVVGFQNRKGSINKLEVIEDENAKQLVNISKFEKVGQDYINPVIKYQIVYKQDFVTWRRYSEIEKLLTYLRCKYQGIVLPEMPPKEGIKSNFSYFWKNEVNQAFLDERKQKLKQLLNRVLSCQYVCQDQILQKFLEDPQYELPNINDSQTYMQTLFGLKDIVFNYNELKDYGMAYYNYISEYKNRTISTECSKQYEKLQKVMASIIAVNDYRVAMNSNFERRRQIMYDSKMKPKGPIKTELDKVLEQAQVQCHQLNMEYSRYLQLKSTEGWQNQLIKQKTSQGGEALEKIKNSHSKTVERIAKTQKNLLVSIKKFSEKSEILVANLGKQIIEWRRKAHP